MPYSTRQQALAISFSLGCEVGAHKNDDGEWMPCRSNKEYREAKKSLTSEKTFRPPLNIQMELMKSGFDVSEMNLSDVEKLREYFISKNQNKSEALMWANDILKEVHDSKVEGMDEDDEEKKKRKKEEMKKGEFTIGTEVCKVDDSLGLVMGWAIVCKVGGEEYYDLQGDHIPEDAMLEAATDFMLNSRVAKDMHLPDGELPGSVVFAFPMTTEVAKSFGIKTKQTGLMIAMKPDSDEILNKFRSGEYTGFSIGGRRIVDE